MTEAEGVSAALKSHSRDNVQKLNIPLSNSYSTTRRSRRVVWIPILILVLLGLAYCASYWWFSRQSITRYVPDGTVMMIRLVPDKETWPLIESHLKNIPLITGKSLTIKDIRYLTRGELVIYYLKNGDVLFGFRGQETDFPQKQWDALGIVVQELDSNRYLLANQIIPVSEVEICRGWNLPKIPYIPGKKLLGQVFFLDQEAKIGKVYGLENGLEIKLPKMDLTSIPWEQVPMNSIAVLSTPFLTNNLKMPEIPSIWMFFDDFEQTNINFSRILAEKLDNIVLTHDENGIGFLLSREQEGLDIQTYKELIKLSVALNAPQTSDFNMPDDSKAQEIIVDPSQVSVQEVVLSGLSWAKAGSRSGEYMLAGHDGKSLVLSNRENLVEFWQGNLGSDVRPPLCGGTHGFINLKELNELSAENINIRNWGLSFPLSEKYASLGVRNGLFSTIISLCF